MSYNMKFETLEHPSPHAAPLSALHPRTLNSIALTPLVAIGIS